MTNYINSIELNNTTYNIGPCYMSGNDNIVVGGSPSFSTGAGSNIVIAPPGTEVSCGSASNGLFIQAGDISIITGRGLDIVNNNSDPWVKIGSAVTINSDELVVGPYRMIKYNFALSSSEDYYYMTVNRPCQLVIMGAVTGSHTYEYDTYSHTYVLSAAAMGIYNVSVYNYDNQWYATAIPVLESGITCYVDHDNTLAVYTGYSESLSCVMFISTFI